MSLTPFQPDFGVLCQGAAWSFMPQPIKATICRNMREKLQQNNAAEKLRTKKARKNCRSKPWKDKLKRETLVSYAKLWYAPTPGSKDFGSKPDNWLWCNDTLNKLVKQSKPMGIEPDSWLWARSKISSPSELMAMGMGPARGGEWREGLRANYSWNLFEHMRFGMSRPNLACSVLWVFPAHF